MNAVAPIVEAKLDPKYTFLVRASVRLWMVDNCEMTLDEAFDDLIADLECDCTREMVRRWEQHYPHKPIKRRKRFR